MPISIAVHLVAVLLFLIIPLTANMMLPDPASRLPDYMRVATAPPPPPAPAVRVRASSTAPPVDRVSPSPPTSAPDVIAPERESAAPVPDLGAPLAGALPGGIGVAAGPPPVVPRPPEPPKQAGPVRVADLPVSPRKIVDVHPIYPDIARTARIEGTVVLEAVIDTSGRVTQVRVLKSVEMLDRAAVDAVSQWRYTPSLYGGHPVSVLMTITMRFTLQ